MDEGKPIRGTSSRSRRMSSSLESKFGPRVKQDPEERLMSRSSSETRKKPFLSIDTEESSSDTNMFDVLVSAAAQRKMSKERKSSKQGPTLYDVLIEAAVEKMGGWRKVTPEDVVNVSKEKSVMDTYNRVSSDLKNNSQLPDPMRNSMTGISLYDTVINTVADIHMLKAEDVLDAAKKQTVYEVLLNAMAQAKTQHSLSLPKDSLYDELISKTRAMPDDVKEMLGQLPPSSTTTTKKLSRSRSRNKSAEPTSQRKSSRREQSDPAPPSTKKKFEEYEKRKTIDDYLKSPKKSSVSFSDDLPLKLQTARERKLTVVNTMRKESSVPPVKLSPGLSSKPDLGDVIIAAAAAKMVKLDPAVPAPTTEEFGAQYCRKVTLE